MFIFEIIRPGTWLDYGNTEGSMRISQILDNLESQFWDANIALNSFISLRSRPVQPFDMEASKREIDRQQEIRNIVQHELGLPATYEYWDQIALEADARFKREKWEAGIEPLTFDHARIFIYARAFVQALDSFIKFMDVLRKEADAPAKVGEIYSEILLAFPQIRPIRNSVQHVEDRSQGLGVGNKPIAVKSIQTGGIDIQEGSVKTIIATGVLGGSRFGCILADGHFGEIDVSEETLSIVQRHFQEVLSLFKWKGPSRHLPY